MHQTRNSSTQCAQSIVVANLLEIAPETRKPEVSWSFGIGKTYHSGISWKTWSFEAMRRPLESWPSDRLTSVWHPSDIRRTLPGVSSNRSGSRGGDRNKSRHQHLQRRWPFENYECAGNWKRFCGKRGKCGDWKPILEKRRSIPIIRDYDSDI